jgi:hypothetical protein
MHAYKNIMIFINSLILAVLLFMLPESIRCHATTSSYLCDITTGWFILHIVAIFGVIFILDSILMALFNHISEIIPCLIIAPSVWLYLIFIGDPTLNNFTTDDSCWLADWRLYF